MTFVQFLTYVNEAIAARGAKEPSLNDHWNTQVSFRWVEAGGQLDEIYDMKQFTLGIDALNARFGIAYRPAKANVTRVWKCR